MKTETLKVHDKHGFHYDVEIAHTPNHGFSTVHYKGSIIADCQLGRILEPMGDNDAEWERYEQLRSEWKDEIMSNLKPKCVEYFNNQQP